MGVVAPNAYGLNAFETALRQGRSGIRVVPRMKELNFSCTVGGIPESVEAIKTAYFKPEVLVAMKVDFISYAAIAAVDAWKDAGLSVPDAMDDRVDWETGACIGTGAGSEGQYDITPVILAGKVKRLGSTHVEQNMVSGASARIAGLLGLGGNVTTNSSACTTGTEAIINGFRAISDGYAERMLVGGTDSSGVYIWAGFDAMRVLASKYNDQPERASRPMSASTDGLVPSAGSGILVLESLDSALKRGARIYAEVLGAHLNSGGQRMTGSMTAPNREGVKRCVRTAIREAGIHAEEIDAINGHLTGTFADPIEFKNWQDALELPAERFPLINATKSLVGHAMGAAGAIESVASVLQLHRGFVHGSANCEDLHPEIQPFAASIPQQTVEKPIRTLIKASFGFGDVNGCVIYRKWEN